jgi:hypothetical protein
VIYFLCHSDPENYQYDIVSLGEGLTELGVPFYANTNYWIQQDGKFLFQSNPAVQPLECDAVVVSTTFLNRVKQSMEIEQGNLPSWLMERRRNHFPAVVALDASDNYLSPITTTWADCFDVILRCHYNRRLWWPSNVKPWGYGLTHRILQSAEKARQPWEKKSGCMYAFGASHRFPHVAREWANRKILPELSRIIPIDSAMDDLNVEPEDPWQARLWKQCTRKHLPGYFARLGTAKACAAFCGDLIPAFPKRPDYLVGGNRAKIRRMLWGGLGRALGLVERNVQPDSLRFWEALASGAVVLHHDAEETGWTLPVPPVAFETYLPASLRGSNRRLFSALRDEKALQRIAETGRKWACENYHPRAVAERFLKLIPGKNACPKK